MKKLIIIVASIFVALSSFSQTAETKIAGNWYAEEMGKSTIKVYKATDGYWYGKITKSEIASNVSKIILLKSKYNAKENIWEGTLKKPDNGMKISTKINFETDDKIKVVCKKSFITKTFYWTRI